MQPKPETIELNGKTYICKPPRMAHRLIIMKARPLFKAIQDLTEGKEPTLSSKQMLEIEEDLDALIGSLIPDLKNVTLDVDDIAVVLEKIIDIAMPDDAKELKDAKVEVQGGLKAERKI